MSPGFPGTFFMPLPSKTLPRVHFNDPNPVLPAEYFFTPLLF